MIQLRPYQREAIHSLYRYFEERIGNPLIVLPTGTGKSVVIAAFVREAVETYPDTRVLMVTHVKELIAQNFAALVRFWPEAPAGIYSAGLNKRDLDAQILFCGIQSVHNKAEKIQQCDLVLVDEAHLIPRTSNTMYRRFLGQLKEINPHLKIIGFTATPYRLDSGMLHKGREALFDAIAYDANVRDMIEQGYLCKITTKATERELDVTGVHRRGGDFIQAELEEAIDQEEVNRAVVAEVARKAGQRGSWLFFCAGVNHARHMVDELRAQNIEAKAVFGDTPAIERDRILSDFKAGRIRALVNVNVLTTGFDAPGVDLIAMCRPTESTGLYVQMCLDRETEILARDGWKKAGEIAVGHEVAGFDLATEGVRWQPVLAAVERELAPGERMVGVSAPHLDFRITDGHDMVLACRSSRLRRSDSPRWRLEQASVAMQRRDQVSLPVAGLLDAPGLPLTDDEIAFLGWFLSDGSLGKNGAIVISQQDGSPQHEHIIATLNGCAFRYGVGRVARNNGYTDLIRYQISRGDARVPNGTGVRGWAVLAPWITKDKIITPAYDDISRDQLLILLEALNRGDGTKRKNIAWTPRTMTITCGLNRLMADRLQALCVTRGIRCNIAFQAPSNWMLYACPDKRRAVIRGTRIDDANANAKLGERETVSGERVWCITTPMGTIITRRNGKVVVTGNCGRGTRLAEGKDNCLILDFAGNAKRHGPIDLIDGSGFHDDEPKGGEAPVKTCPECKEIVHAAVRMCPACGHEFPAPKPAVAPQIIKGAVISTEIEPEWLPVKDVRFNLHLKPDAPPSMRVSYLCGLVAYNEWVCFEHRGFPREKAVTWWSRRSPGAPVPTTVEEALKRAPDLPRPTHISVRQAGRYFDITGVRF